MSRSKRIALFIALLSALLLPTIASAHDHRDVGKYAFTVGFVNEPAFEGEQNGIWVKVVDDASEAPVENLAGTLKAQVIMGAQTLDLPLEAAFNQPGVYIANFYPTAAGDYTFRFFGAVEGQNVDETFTSSPEGFSAVEPTDALQFPAKVPSATQLSAELASAQSTARMALIVAGLGLVVGIAGAATAVVALRGRSAGTANRSQAAARS